MAKLAFYGNGPAVVGKAGAEFPIHSFVGKTDEHGNELHDADGILIHDPQSISPELEAEIRANLAGWEAKGFRLIEDRDRLEEAPSKRAKKNEVSEKR